MIQLRFRPEDLAGVRFAFSLLVEVAVSLRVLRDSARHALHRPRVRSAERELERIFPALGVDAPTRMASEG